MRDQIPQTSRRDSVEITGMEARILHSVVPLAAEAVELIAPLSDSQSASDSDPLGLASDVEDGSRVFVVDPNHPNAIHDVTDLAREDISVDTPLGSLDALNNARFLHEGDTVYLRGGEYTINSQIKVFRNDVTFASYPGETATLRHGSFVYDWAMNVKGDGFRMDRLEFVGNVDTPDGRLFSSLILLIQGNDATIENSIFRHNANFLPPELGGDIAFGNRVNTNGELLSDVAQKHGRLVAFEDVTDGVFRNNVVVNLEDATLEHWVRRATSVEGLLIDGSEVVVEGNQFAKPGHQSVASRGSTSLIRNNTFGDVSKYADMLGIEISPYVLGANTHTAASFYLNDGSEFINNIVSFNTANPEDTGNGLQVSGSVNSEIFNNLFVDSGGTGKAISIGVNPGDVEVAYNRVYNNTFVNVPGAIALEHYSIRAPDGSNKVHHNEVFGNIILYSDEVKTNPYTGTNAPIILDIGDAIGGNGNRVYNNVVYDQDSVTAAKIRGDNVYTIDELNSLSYASGNIAMEIRFANVAVGDFRLLGSHEDFTGLGSEPNATGFDFHGGVRNAADSVGAFAVYHVSSATGGERESGVEVFAPLSAGRGSADDGKEESDALVKLTRLTHELPSVTGQERLAPVSSFAVQRFAKTPSTGQSIGISYALGEAKDAESQSAPSESFRYLRTIRSQHSIE